MILLQRYLRTLQLFLPKAQREDIIRELSEEIETDIAEQERELGRSLRAEEEAAIIGKYGHPLLAAARYRRQQYLIGPLMFPYYWLLLRVVLVLMLAGHVIGGAILLANGAGWSQVGDLAERLVQTSLMAFGWLTLLTAVADVWITRSRMLQKWNPRTLVFRSSARSSAPATTTGTAPSVSSFIVQAAIGAWWLLALKFPILLFAGGADIVAWAPAMNRLYPVLALSLITELANQFAALWLPHEKRLSRITPVVLGVSSLAVLVPHRDIRPSMGCLERSGTTGRTSRQSGELRVLDCLDGRGSRRDGESTVGPVQMVQQTDEACRCGPMSRSCCARSGRTGAGDRRVVVAK